MNGINIKVLINVNLIEEYRYEQTFIPWTSISALTYRPFNPMRNESEMILMQLSNGQTRSFKKHELAETSWSLLLDIIRGNHGT